MHCNKKNTRGAEQFYTAGRTKKNDKQRRIFGFAEFFRTFVVIFVQGYPDTTVFVDFIVHIAELWNTPIF